MSVELELGRIAVRDQELRLEIEAETPEQEKARLHAEAERLRTEEAERRQVAAAAYELAAREYPELADRADEATRNFGDAVEAAANARRQLIKLHQEAASRDVLPDPLNARVARMTSEAYALREARARARLATQTSY